MPVPYQLRRHPIPITCRFDRSLVLTWAFPAEVLEPMVPPGLTLDTIGPNADGDADGGVGVGEGAGAVLTERWGFVAVAVVQARALRPRGLPAWMGRRFALIGYRVFVRHRDRAGRIRRGLHILSSDTDRGLMRLGGDLLTHYRYRRSAIVITESADHFQVEVSTAEGVADLRVVAHLDPAPVPLPPSSPFSTAAAARRFAGPLPWTFDHEPQTSSIVMVRGRRSQWHPHPVAVDVDRCTFFESGAFAGAEPRLANAFTMEGVDYGWDRGVRTPIRAGDRGGGAAPARHRDVGSAA